MARTFGWISNKKGETKNIDVEMPKSLSAIIIGGITILGVGAYAFIKEIFYRGAREGFQTESDVLDNLGLLDQNSDETDDYTRAL